MYVAPLQLMIWNIMKRHIPYIIDLVPLYPCYHLNLLRTKCLYLGPLPRTSITKLNSYKKKKKTSNDNTYLIPKYVYKISSDGNLMFLTYSVNLVISFLFVFNNLFLILLIALTFPVFFP